jgi:hypothetical protein
LKHFIRQARGVGPLANQTTPKIRVHLHKPLESRRKALASGLIYLRTIAGLPLLER